MYHFYMYMSRFCYMFLWHFHRPMKVKNTSGFRRRITLKSFLMIILIVTIVHTVSYPFRSYWDSSSDRISYDKSSKESVHCSKKNGDHVLSVGCPCERAKDCMSGVCNNRKCQGKLVTNSKPLFSIAIPFYYSLSQSLSYYNISTLKV